jgi:hypothetical protein
VPKKAADDEHATPAAIRVISANALAGAAALRRVAAIHFGRVAASGKVKLLEGGVRT